jgi:general secretion pathway protein A
VVLIVDEAQTLSPELLEQVRLLTNLETAKQKLLQIILIGQPELRELLDDLQMRQIAQRITGRYHLEPLRREDTRAYVSHRLRVAGAQRDVFTRRAVSALYRHSRGVPRLINVIADRALLAAYTQDRHDVDAKLVGQAAAEVFGVRRKTTWWPAVTAIAGAAALVFGITNLGEAPAPSTAPADATSFLAASPAPTPSAALPQAAPPPNDTSNPVGADVVGSGAASTLDAGSAQAAPPVTLEFLLADARLHVATDDAIAALLARWGASYDGARGEPCVQALEQGLRCSFQRRGTLSELRRVGWPAVLSLVTADGAEHPVVVAGLGYDHAKLLAGGREHSLPLAELSFSWYGDYLVLWRPGDAPERDLAPGVDDEGVRWLRRTLAALDGEPAANEGSTQYDAALEARVRAYQRAHQLTVDGIVGARTQIALLADVGLAGAPTLELKH